MRSFRYLVLAAPFLLAACGSSEPKTVVVAPAQPAATTGNTVVVPQGSSVRVCPSGTVC